MRISIGRPDRAVVLAALACAALGVAPGAAAADIRGDFNGDGRADLAVGVPGEDLGEVRDAGAVNVVYGSPDGLTAAGNQLWSQDSPGVEDQAEPFDRFGEALAVWDFDGDGFDDLAIGAPNEDVGDVTGAGAVNVLYGSASGLTAARNQLFSQDTPEVEDVAEEFDGYGTALTAGDFDGDGFADLAVGIPDEDLGDELGSAGAVNVLYGTAAGLSAVDDQLWTQDGPRVHGKAEPFDQLGWSLDAGDLDGDGSDDLAAGVRGESVGRIDGAGAVTVLYGSPRGLRAIGSQEWTQDSPGIDNRAEEFDELGTAVAIGDFDGDGFGDLAAGAPGDDVRQISDAGVVNVIYGSPGGLSPAGNQLWHQDRPGVEDEAEEFDLFGRALAAGDLDADAVDDLAVGVPEESLGEASFTGVVNVLYGSPAGLTADGDQLWSQDAPDVEGEAQDSENFGDALATGDFDGDGAADLAVAVVGERGPTGPVAGAVNVLYGTPGAGLAADGDQLWSQDSPGIEDESEPFDAFGADVASS